MSRLERTRDRVINTQVSTVSRDKGSPRPTKDLRCARDRLEEHVNTVEEAKTTETNRSGKPGPLQKE